ncbi:hypothetical protein NUITMVS3_35360 [Shewanella xiamenensis]|nr:hypothetical protein NUITMVS2_24810 [Shewanella xiamenensis]GLD79102.1 hypothetical protein NUITMVS3_35360 [Shewanella xiamenensis]
MQNIAANSADALATIEKRDFFVEPPKDGFTACRQSISAVALDRFNGLSKAIKSPDLYSGLT